MIRACMSRVEGEESVPGLEGKVLVRLHTFGKASVTDGRVNKVI